MKTEAMKSLLSSVSVLETKLVSAKNLNKQLQSLLNRERTVSKALALDLAKSQVAMTELKKYDEDIRSSYEGRTALHLAAVAKIRKLSKANKELKKDIAMRYI